MGSSTCNWNHLEAWNKKAQYQMDLEFCDCFLKIALEKTLKEERESKISLNLNLKDFCEVLKQFE